MTAETQYVFPGDIIRNIKCVRNQTIVGPGLRRIEDEPNSLCATQPGKLIFKSPNVYWIEGKRSRYIPKKGDLVVGVIVKKSTDTLKVDIGSAESASLSMLTFEGATKKQKPDVQVGDVVYAKLLNAYKEMEPELVCVDQYFKAGRLGVLSNEGFLINVDKQFAQSLLNVENPLLRTFGKKFPFEIVIGVNGKVWINAKKSKDVLILLKAFDIAQQESESRIIEVCRQLK